MHGSPYSGHRTMALLACMLATSMADPVRAATFSTETFFTANDRSIWTSGAGFTLDTGPRFLGETWDVGKTVGGIDDVCVPLAGCAHFGAEIGARTSGRAGVNYGLKVDSGTFNVQFPGVASFGIPDTVMGSTVGAITIGSSYSGLPSLNVPTSANGPAVARTPYLQVNGPTAQAYLDLAAELHAFAGATVCVVVCYGPALGPIDVNKSQELAAVNRNGDGQVRLLGNSVSAAQNISALDGLVNINLKLPHLDSNSDTTPGGSSVSLLRSATQDRVIAVNANVAQIIADAAGLPIPLSGNLGPFGYNLLQSNAGVAIDVAQSLTFVPNVTGSYVFSSPVTPEVDGVDLPLTSRIDFNFGDDVTFKPGQVGAISFLPLINFGGTLHNETDLVIGGDISVKALGVNIAGASVGPLIDEHLGSADIGRIPLYDQTFGETFGSVTAAPISLDFDACRNRIGGEPEFPILGVCASSGITDFGPFAQNPDGTYEDLLDRFGCGPETSSGPGTCFEFPGGFTSPYIVSSSGNVFLNDPGSGLAFDPNAPEPPTTPADQAAILASLGFPNTDSFVIPDGATLQSFAVPEPDTTSRLGGAGISALAVVRSRKRAARFT